MVREMELVRGVELVRRMELVRGKDGKELVREMVQP